MDKDTQCLIAKKDLTTSLVADVITLGRKIADQVPAHLSETKIHSCNEVAGLLKHLKNRDAFNASVSAALAPFVDLLEGCLAPEIISTDFDCLETRYGPDGPECEYREVTRYTETGEEVARMRDRVLTFELQRNLALDRLAALRLMQTIL